MASCLQTGGAVCRRDGFTYSTLALLDLFTSTCLLSYSMLCWLPDLLLAFGEAFGILYMNVLDEAF